MGKKIMDISVRIFIFINLPLNMIKARKHLAFIISFFCIKYDFSIGYKRYPAAFNISLAVSTESVP